MTYPLSISCNNYGANLNIVEDGRCNYYNSILDVAKYNWILEDISN